MKRQWISRCALITALGVGVLLAPGISAGASTKATGSPLVFGDIGTLSGPLGFPEPSQSLQDYVANWNAHGGFKGHPIRIVVEDGGIDPTATGDAARTLVTSDNVIGMVSNAALLDCSVNNQFYIANQVGVLGGGCSPTTGYDPKIDFAISKINGSDSLSVLVKFAIAHGAKKVAILAPPVPGFDTIFAVVNTYVETTKATLVVPPALPLVPTAAEVDSTLASLKSQGVDAIVGLIQGSTAALVVQQANLQSFGPAQGIRFFWGPTLYGPEFAASLPGTYALTYGYPWSDTNNPEVAAALKVIKNGPVKVTSLDGFAQVGYQTGVVLQQVLNKVSGPVTRASFRRALAKTTSASLVLTPINVNLAHPQKDAEGGEVVQSKGGKWVSVSGFITTTF